MTFWIITFLIALVSAGLLAIALLRGRSGAEPAAAYDLKVYRDQLRDVDRDLARGTLNEADATRIRTEVSRRILTADAQLQKAQSGDDQPRMVTWVMVSVTALVLIGGSLALYSTIGAPGYPDLGLETRIARSDEARKTRPSQAEAEARLPVQTLPAPEPGYADLVAKLRDTVAKRPDDIQGLELLARHESNLGNFSAAHAAKARVVDIKGDAATALDYAELAEVLIAAAGGYVSPEAEDALRQTLKRDPGNGPARYFWGLMLAQADRPDLAFRIWEQTLRNGPADAPWIVPIRERIEEIAYRAGVEYQLPAAPAAPALAGPSEDDMRAASEMTAQERQDMVRGMVDQLSERLATEGGSPAEWARLVGALNVLGETDRARAIYDEALGVFAANPEALALIRATGTKAGFDQ